MIHAGFTIVFGGPEFRPEDFLRDSCLQQLISFAGNADRHIDLCDHIAAYSSEQPILIYHGVFWEPLFVSTRIPRCHIEEFSRNIGVSFEEIDFYETYKP